MKRKDFDLDSLDGDLGQRHEDGVYPSASHDKPANEGINNTDVPGVPESKKAKNNPTHQDEGLSGYIGDSSVIGESEL